MQNIQNLIQLLQTAISPIVLISGVGLLLLSLTNRMGRVIDRSRYLVQEIEAGKDDHKKHVQIGILYRRSHILRASITCISITILFASIMILELFIGYFSHLDISNSFIAFFVLAVITLILGILLFLVDIAVTLKALKLQVQEYIK
ncbi:MAG: DUF2721 domain-containing protein [Candidatus Cloacimonetes bacterium]|nr:DUF2721 domain-containing protein [Candidatus Cloacimonadota bacterium]MCF7813876.1 DUF2721 domain-containing protein [Candidatus Cloacimonadota bacterium]MCF7868913.1 DUF2721 domain-containing protein [Candidatus Cloacimonadota bacterium]MCF7883988.1 DUF2721 domain-containing protein [Candidatus Cloacimonadota bacterium]